MSGSRAQVLSLRRIAACAAILVLPLGGAAAVAAPRPAPAKVSVTPASAAIGAVNTFVFKYQATVALAAVDVTLVVPGGWTAPVTGPSTAAGYVSVQKGNCTIPAPAISVTGSGPWTVTVHGVTCGSSKTFTITYAKATTAGPVGAATFASTVAGVALAPAVVNVVTGPAAKLAFVQQPDGATGGTAFATQPKVAIEDAAGNVVAGNTSKVNLSITSGTGTAGATFTCTADPLAAVAGVATFAGCKINKVGTGYRLHATDGSLTATDSTPFAVAAGPATKMVFTTQPGGTGASVGTALPAQPVVTLQDAGGNTATGDASSVKLAITAGTGTAGAALGCATNPLAATTGVAAFTGCTVGLAGTGYKLHATDGALPAVDSAAFDVVNGAPTQLAFVQQPGGATGGTAFTTQPKVAIQDAAGTTVTADTSAVTLTVTPLTGTSGAAFSCTADPVSAVAGVATFSGCDIDKVGTGYTLHATDGSLTPADSDPFDVTAGPAVGLRFVGTPGGGATGGVEFPAQPVVGLVDAGGNPASTSSATLTLALNSGTGTPGAALACAPSIAVTVAGVATFTHCRIGKAGTGYTLHATKLGGGLTPADSDPFDVTVGPAAYLVFTGQPGGGDADSAWASQPEVSVTDTGGNVVTTDTSAVTLSVTALTGDPTAVLTCDTDPVTAVAGVATFAGCTIDKAATGYTLHATDGTLPAADSDSFDVIGGAAASLAFTVQPGGGDADGAWPTQPEVTLYDAHGNVADDDTSSVTLAVTTGTGAYGSALTCDDNPVTAVAGVATFAGCTIDLAATYYQLSASSGAFTPVDSDPFDVTVGAATHLVFTGQPEGAPDLCAYAFDEGCFLQLIGLLPPPGIVSGMPFFVPPAVAVEDAHGNVVTDDASAVTLAITDENGTDGAVLSCATNPVTVTDGVAVFGTPGFFGPPSGCSIDLAGTGYQLHATDGSLDPADSVTFDVVPGAPDSVTVSLSPDTITAGVAAVPTATITVTDAAGNVLPGWAGALSLTSTGDADLGTVTENPDHTYSATFDADVAGTQDVTAHLRLFNFFFGPYEISSLPATLTVLAGPPTQVVFTSAPYDGFGNPALSEGAISGPITVQLQDEYGNPATSANPTTLELSTSSSGGSFRGEADDVTEITAIVIGSGETDGTFRYYDENGGSPTIGIANPFGSVPPFFTQIEDVAT
jgi:hypothetical protein